MTAAIDDNMAEKNLRNAMLFHGLGPEVIAEILAGGRQEVYGQGEYLYRQGQRSRRFFLVAAGEIELTFCLQGGGEHLVGRIGPGGHFGETSLLADQDNGLNARALTETTVLAYDEHIFRTLLLGNGTIGQQLNLCLAERLRVSFIDHARTLDKALGPGSLSPRHLDRSFLDAALRSQPAATGADRGLRFAESTIAKQIAKAVEQFKKIALIKKAGGTGGTMGTFMEDWKKMDCMCL